ncbi:MAG: flavin monoamine oxidase family protein [Gemmatimonadales bacterium]
MVGGGVAGLAAARRLAQASRSVLLLEARPRLGGRVHTILDAPTGHAVELGAEFLQGQPEALLEIIQSAGLTLQEIPEWHERAREGRRSDFPDVESLVDRLLACNPNRHDVPVAQLIRQCTGKFRPDELEAMTGYLEGFHAADLERFGTAALADNQAAEEEDVGHIARLAGGYGQVVQQLAQNLKPELVQIRTGVVVTRLEWKPGSVQVEARTATGEPLRARAAQAILAVPLTTLKANRSEEGALFPDPAPAGWSDALERLEMGPAQHIVLRFESAWWMEQDGPPPVFLHGRGEPVPVWWTGSPPEVPFLTGWAGGPQALRLAGQTVKQLIPLALGSAARIFGREARVLARELRAAYSHDWTSDPYARGAYSYGGVGAARARELLRRPVSGTLFLSGEALVDEGRNATVPGALTSGIRSAEALLQT